MSGNIIGKLPDDFENQLMKQANEQFELLEQPIEEEGVDKKNEEDELTEEQRERRRVILAVQTTNKKLLYSIHQKDLEITRVTREIDDHKIMLQHLIDQDQKTEDNLEGYLSHRALVCYDTYLRGSLREQDKKIYELELNNADIGEIQARIEKINREYEKNIQPLVVGDFKSQIDADIKGSKNQIEALRNQFKEIVDDIVKLHEKHLDNIDMYSTLQRQLQEQLLANEQLEIELGQGKKV